MRDWSSQNIWITTGLNPALQWTLIFFRMVLEWQADQAEKFHNNSASPWRRSGVNSLWIVWEGFLQLSRCTRLVWMMGVGLLNKCCHHGSKLKKFIKNHSSLFEILVKNLFEFHNWSKRKSPKAHICIELYSSRTHFLMIHIMKMWWESFGRLIYRYSKHPHEMSNLYWRIKW